MDQIYVCLIHKVSMFLSMKFLKNYHLDKFYSKDGFLNFEYVDNFIYILFWKIDGLYEVIYYMRLFWLGILND